MGHQFWNANVVFFFCVTAALFIWAGWLPNPVPVYVRTNTTDTIIGNVTNLLHDPPAFLTANRYTITVDNNFTFDTTRENYLMFHIGSGIKVDRVYYQLKTDFGKYTNSTLPGYWEVVGVSQFSKNQD